MAIPLVIILASLALIGATALFRMNQDDVPRMQLGFVRLQGEFLAKGALQLARLKCRLLPTAAYDAAAFARGANPYFDHSTTGYDNFRAALDRNVWHGPLFFTGVATPLTAGYARSNVRDVDLNGSEGTEDRTPTGAWICEQYLNEFARDLRSGTRDNGLVILLDSSSVDPVTGLADPFTGSFLVSSVRVLGFAGGRKYNEEAIEFKVEATVDAQVVGALTRIVKTFRQEAMAVYRVTRTR